MSGGSELRQPEKTAVTIIDERAAAIFQAPEAIFTIEAVATAVTQDEP